METSPTEKPIQRLLEEYPQILCRLLGAGYCWWIKQEVWLGQEFRLDFLAARTESLTLNYRLVELQSPAAKWINPSNGKPATQMVEATQQVSDWYHWISLNHDYAKREKPFGLGLVNLTPLAATGHIIIGQRKNVTRSDRQRMNAIRSSSGRYWLNTYDSLIEAAKRAPENFYGDGGGDACSECQYLLD
ncbi:hypothetical protein BV401_22335 [Streptomyces malaysiensis subsp. malaysiensis]|uniref:Shedu protein SduA C-terminal domain-containing protein n=1 Tax=Streptomyces autolyticus TaxID=75293 RepID=A0ABM6HFP2_9ACTN|nr:hypothetical protein BV401_22335 [Streptomyces autolyticus]